MIASKYSICDREKKDLGIYTNVQCLNIAPIERAWFMALMDKELERKWNIPS